MAFFNAPPYRGPVSDHFDGERFHNETRAPHGSLGDVAKWMLKRKRGPWERRDAEPGPPPPERVHGSTLRITLVGHATLLVQMQGLNVLTDPVWAERTSPVAWAGPKRFRPPGLRFEDLPPIDLVLISHNHYDHLCLPTLKRLKAHSNPAIVTGLGNRALLRLHGLECTELDWWQESAVAGARVHAVPMQHFSGRGPGDRDRTLWCGLWVHHEAGEVLFAGDTGYGAHFQEIHTRLGAPRCALLPIGAYQPTWFMNHVHVTPAQAVRAHQDLHARTSVAMHYGTFALADDGQDEPLRDLEQAREAEGLGADVFRVLDHGVGSELP